MLDARGDRNGDRGEPKQEKLGWVHVYKSIPVPSWRWNLETPHLLSVPVPESLLEPSASP